DLAESPPYPGKIVGDRRNRETALTGQLIVGAGLLVEVVAFKQAEMLHLRGLPAFPLERVDREIENAPPTFAVKVFIRRGHVTIQRDVLDGPATLDSCGELSLVRHEVIDARAQKCAKASATGVVRFEEFLLA